MTRIESEKSTIRKMISLYCRHKEGNKSLCPSCAELLEYAIARLSRCPYGNRKSTCRKCTVHCYRPDMADRIRKVMRYSGPRMMLYSPIEAIRHLIRELTQQ